MPNNFGNSHGIRGNQPPGGPPVGRGLPGLRMRPQVIVADDELPTAASNSDNDNAGAG